MRNGLPIGMLALALAACSNTKSADKADAQAVAKIEAAETVGPPAPGVPMLNEHVSPSRAIQEAKILPAQFQGRWGMTTKDCDVSRNDNTGKLVIKDDTLTFFDSTATIAALKAETRYKIALDLAFKDGAKTWRKHTLLELILGGTTLVRTERNPAETFRYTRC